MCLGFLQPPTIIEFLLETVSKFIMFRSEIVQRLLPSLFMSQCISTLLSKCNFLFPSGSTIISVSWEVMTISLKLKVVKRLNICVMIEISVDNLILHY